MNFPTALPIAIELLAKSALISLAALLLLKGWRGATSAQRHLVWLVALATVMMLPGTRLVAPFWKIPLAPAKKAPVVVTVRPIEYRVPLELAAPMDEPIVALPVREPLDWRLILLGMWCGGTALLLGYRLFGSWRLHRLLRRSVPVDDPRIRLLLSRTLSELGLRRRPEIRLSEECRVPITWGSLRPVMLLPKAALKWSDNWILAALRHEGAHIRRYDYLTRWFAHVACALYWPNPLVWMLARSLRIAQELAADDLVLRAGTPPEEYASQLVDAARTVTTHGFFVRQAVAMACPSTLEDRVRAIVDGRRDRRPLSRLAAACGSLTIALVLGVSTAAQLRSDEQKPAPAPAADTPAADAPPAGSAPARPAAPGPQIEIESKFIELTTPVGKVPPPVPEKPAIYTDPQFQVIIRALNQKKGVDLLSAPRVTTKDNQRATMEVVREFRYATAWEKDGKKWKQTDSEIKKCGVTLDVTPRIIKSGALELHVVATIVEFLGFIDLDNGSKPPTKKKYGTTTVSDFPPVPAGHRTKPVFSEDKSDKTVTLESGETVGLFVRGAASVQHVVDGKKSWDDVYRRQTMLYVSSRIIEPAPVKKAAKEGQASKEGDAAAAPTLVASADDQIQFTKPAFEGRILALNAERHFVVLNAGEKRGVVKDAALQVVRGNESIAQLRVTSVEPSTSIADILPDSVRKGITLQPSDIVLAANADPKGAGNPPVKELNLNGGTFVLNDGPITKEWKIPFDIIPAKPDNSGPIPAKGWLVSKGVKFEGSASAVFILGNSRLIVRNSQEQLNLVDHIIGEAAEEQGKAEKASGNLGGVSDEIFARRRYVDFLGRLPTPDEVKVFLAAPQASAEKRQVLIEKLTAELRTQAGKPDGAKAAAGDFVTAAREWERAVAARTATAESVAQQKAEKIVIPKLELTEATLNEALEILRKKALEADPEKTGVKIVVKPGVTSDAHITLLLRNIPVIEAMKYVTGLANLEFSATPEALVVHPADAGKTDPEPAPKGAGPQGSAGPGRTLTYTGAITLSGSLDTIVSTGTVTLAGDVTTAAESPARQKAKKLIIPVLDFKEATLDEALDILRKKAVEADPEKTGVKIVLKPGLTSDARITIYALKEVSVLEALRYITDLANLEFAETPDAFVVQPDSRPKAPATDAPDIPGLDKPRGGAANANDPKVEIAAQSATFNGKTKESVLENATVKIERPGKTPYTLTADKLTVHPPEDGANPPGKPAAAAAVPGSNASGKPSPEIEKGWRRTERNILTCHSRVQIAPKWRRWKKSAWRNSRPGTQSRPNHEAVPYPSPAIRPPIRRPKTTRRRASNGSRRKPPPMRPSSNVSSSKWPSCKPKRARCLFRAARSSIHRRTIPATSS